MEAGDCMYLPAWHIHYVRSWGRNIAGMYMIQTGAKFDKATCDKGYPKESTPLGDFDILWNFPGAPNTAGYNQVKMGYPDWKRQFREPLAQYARNGRLSKEIFMSWFGQVFPKQGGHEQDDDDDDNQDRRGSGVIASEGSANNGGALVWASIAGSGDADSMPLSELYCNGKMAELFRTLAVGSEGRAEQDLDSRIARFDLQGNAKKVVERDDL